MENIEPYQIWLVIAAVGYAGFLLGRATKGPGAEERARRAFAEDEEIRTAMDELAPTKLEEIDRLMAERKKIEAIKVLREASGLGLKLAKMAVEQRAGGR